MKISVICLCLLFQTATLEEQPALDGTQHQMRQHNLPQAFIKPDQSADSVQKPDSVHGGKPESDLKDKPDPKLEEQPALDGTQHQMRQHNLPQAFIKPDQSADSVLKPESDLKDKPDPKLEEQPALDGTQHQIRQHNLPQAFIKPDQSADSVQKPDSVHGGKPESDLKDKPDPKFGEKTESDLKDKPDTKLEEEKTKQKSNEDFLSHQCLLQKYTRLSCSKVFCPPWRRCISGQCVCKMPYKCPRQDKLACTLDGSQYYSMCQAKAISCRSSEPVFSHFSSACSEEQKVEVLLKESGSHNVVMIKTGKVTMLVCGREWTMASANVVCRNPLKVARGAEVATKIPHSTLDKATDWPTECMKVRCTGSELSLAECTIYKPQPITPSSKVAVAKCYEPKETCGAFLCTNGKCLNEGKPCNGIDDCGDNSDEMCCQRCVESRAFHCKSDVCIPHQAVRDGVRDCLGGEDELEENTKPVDIDPQDLFSDPMSEIRAIRSSTESQLQCGVPNMEYVYKQEDDTTLRQHRKRFVGWEEALPTQIQWQVAIEDEGSIDCGGVYLGGCWVLTAAQCVRPKPKSYRIMFSLWKKHRKQSTTDSIPVKNIIIHHEYNAQTYANDIALVQLEPLIFEDKCMKDNPAVRAVCVPWSTQQFQPNDTCTISGWGRNRAGMSSAILKWANVTIIGDCKHYYKDRFLPGMECAGDLEGKVDSCQGDSGGPLVCKDASGVSYVWGIVSWGEKCGEANHPGVYTKVAHYFDWIRFHTGWAAVTKYNQ